VETGLKNPNEDYRRRAVLIVYESEDAAQVQEEYVSIEGAWEPTLVSTGEITDDFDFWLELPDGHILRVLLARDALPRQRVPDQPSLAFDFASPATEIPQPVHWNDDVRDELDRMRSLLEEHLPDDEE
jgi:hypothetical protein